MNPTNWRQKVKHKQIRNSSLYCDVSDRVDRDYEPLNFDDFIVKESEKMGMSGTNFRQTSTELE